MATKTLAQKLYIRPGHTVALLNAPKGAVDLLEPLPDDVKVVTTKKRESDLILCFVKNSAEIAKHAKDLKANFDEHVILWFAYPKLSSKTATDLTRDHGWTALYDLGLEGVAAVAIDKVWSALRFKQRFATSDEEVITKQYAGERSQFKPIFEQLVSTIKSQGPDVEMSVRQSYVAFARSKQFALLKPARDRLDLVLKMPNAPLGGRLIPAANLGSGSMTHRVPLTKLDEIDFEVLKWIHEAYTGVNK